MDVMNAIVFINVSRMYIHRAGTVISEKVFTMLIIREINEKISQASNLHKTCQPNRDKNLRCVTKLSYTLNL